MRNKVIDAQEAAALVPDGATLGTVGAAVVFCGTLEANGVDYEVGELSVTIKRYGQIRTFELCLGKRDLAAVSHFTRREQR